MNISSFLSPVNVVIDLPARDKAGLLNDLAARAAPALGMSLARLAGEIAKRDELGSTGIGGGVCIPHARFRDVGTSFGFFARLSKPVAFDAIDGQPVDLAFLLVLPAASQLEQLNVLACVARKLREPDLLRRLREADSAGALYRIVTER